MKSSPNTFLLAILILPFCLWCTSCSETEQDPDPDAGLLKIAESYAAGAATLVELYAHEALLAGYNPLFIKLTDSVTGRPQTHLLPIMYPEMQMTSMKHSCPVEDLEPEPNGWFAGAIMFTMPSGEMGDWSLGVSVLSLDKTLSGKATLDIAVEALTPSKVLSFVGDNERRYYISPYFPEGTETGVNKLEIVAFTSEEGVYLPVEDLQIIMTPEMPSMDHGSPNNQNPAHIGGGHYEGKVNFTMSGEWRVNLSMTHGNTALGPRYFDVIVK